MMSRSGRVPADGQGAGISSQPTPTAIDTSSSSVSGLEIVGIALGSLALGFAAALLLLRFIPHRTARA